MLIDTLKALYRRDLARVGDEIELYQEESLLWRLAPGTSNRPGNLCLHIEGNLKHFIGAVLGSTGYVRQRDREFSDRDVPREALIRGIEETAAMIDRVLDTLGPENLAAEYPIAVFGEAMSTEYFLVHLSTHVNYHFGQINYHRRMLDRKDASRQ